MPKPVLLTLDDDPEVLRAVERDLRKKYADRYRIVRADSGASALQSLQTLKKRNEAVALLLVDQRMPEMSGVEFLNKAIAIFPEAKRVLLTAYADTDAAIQAINQARIQHYLLKPWDPPEDQLYPVLDDLLEDWQAGYRPVFDGVRVLGHRWSPRSYALRDFLARNRVPYRWLDAEMGERNKEVQEALEVAERENLKLPTAIFMDNTALADPSTSELAAKLGLRTTATTSFYDLLIVGGGPAGLAAAVYGASEGLTTVMIEREAPGGQAGMSSRIENYLGFPSGISGSLLTQRAVMQARRFCVEILAPHEATALRVDGGSKFVKLVRGNSLAAGMSQYLVEQIKETPNIHVELNSEVTEAFGKERLEAISILCSSSGETQKVPAASLFIFIGAAPQTEWLHGTVERDEKGFILTGADLLSLGKPPKSWSIEREPWLLEASVPGIFVAGDVRYRSIKRVASGVGEGANAVQFVHQYLGSV